MPRCRERGSQECAKFVRKVAAPAVDLCAGDVAHGIVEGQAEQPRRVRHWRLRLDRASVALSRRDWRQSSRTFYGR